uniref:E3 ubiquitin-protein ligase n=1 Tax=Gadus morhua TaxID=8049 RepID=A0A8C5B1J1_GADMO
MHDVFMCSLVSDACHFMPSVGYMVPRTYHLDTVLDPQEEERVQKCLLHPLECFLFGEDPEEGLAKLKQGSESSGICGRVFKEGETVYSCRDCAIDPTCVLCMDCFQESVHKGHRYKMHASSGGGFCDCGDLEAWKIGPCCAIHDQGTARAEQLFRCLLRYVTEMLVWEKYYELPEDLEVDEEVYLCVLYNDDHHSFDHVIYSLQRSIKCTQAVAQAHTALIDKEGRWIVKKGTVLACQEVNDLIESNSKHISQEALRVEVLLYAVVAHQTFALRLGNWFQKIVGYSGKSVKVSALAHLISVVWSLLTLFFWSLPLGARRIVYELIFCSLLMDTESKRLFAIEFTKNYDMLQQCFIFDYHDRSIFISSLSVQIFTVPTLARHLIEEAKVIKVIVGTIMEVLKGHLCDSNRFQFQGYNSDKFFRIHVIFHDLRYILISKPTEWTDALRTAFLEGFKAFLDLLGCMQGMEEVKRQFGQHIEVEPEWEAGFSLQIQLRHILSMFQDWCASDETVLLQAFRECHGALIHCNHRANQSEPTDFYMCKQILHIRPYKVSQEPVSIHLPISRLFAGLYLHLCRTGAIERLHQHASYDYTYLAEHSLRCLVLVAQVSAEMWRRNGLSLVSQVYYYQDVKCRDEMYDKDVLMLQIAASKMDPNHFLMLLLLRFELFDVFNGSTSGKDQELLKQWNRLTEEMLFLLIVIIGERYVPGVSEVTKEDVTMREVIHLLCIEPMAHSGLVKGLPENSHETGLESVISKVSNFKKPGVSGHGLYEVKKECLPEFNPFFYHYSKSQHSKAEDSQKKRRAQEGTDQALRPPVPPAFCPAFSSVVRLLSCDIFVHILRRVLQRAAKDRSTQWTEAMVQRALHLIGQALLEEKSQLEAAADEEVAFDFSVKARGTKSVFQLLTKVKSLPALEGHSDMVKRVELYMCLAPGGWRAMNRPKALPSSLLSPQVAQDKDKAERKRKADAAKLHRQKIMAQMSAMQRNFIESNKMLYDNMPDSSSSHPGPARERCVALGPQRGSTPAQREVLTCILCQEEQEVAALSQAMVLTACVQRSTVLTQCRGKALGTENASPSNSLFMSPELVVGTHTGSCGHIMHSSCWQKYFEAIQNTTRNRLHAELIIDLENGQYLCPLCKSLCNTVVPLVPLEPLTIDYENAEIVGQHLTLPRWILILLARINGLKSINHKGASPEEASGLCGEGRPDFRSILSFGVQEPRKFSDSIAEMLVVCATTVHRVGLETPPNELCPHVPTMAWNTCAFTIQAIGEPSRTHDAPPLSPVLLPTISRENTPSILEVDFFHLLVGMVLSVPALYHEEAVELQPSAVSSAYNHLYILHLVTMAHLVQVLLTSARIRCDTMRSTIFKCQDVRTTYNNSDVSGSAVAEGVKRAITPFLRCTALFFNGLTGVPPPVEISSTAGHSGVHENTEVLRYIDTYCNVKLHYPQMLLEMLLAVGPEVTVSWSPPPCRYPRRRNHLIDLPADYSSLLNQASHFKCPKSNDGERKHPTLCLVCGTMLCSQSTCCQSQLEGEDVGACTAHAATCGAGVGVFLSIRECEIVLKASKTRGSTYPAPYLDDYGETDPQLVRGNPLHLCPERYKKLHQLWQQHCVLEEIARSLEVDNVMFALEWQML